MDRVVSVVVQELRPREDAHDSPRAQPQALTARKTSKIRSVSRGCQRQWISREVIQVHRNVMWLPCSLYICVCVTQIKRKAERGQETEIEKVSL